MRSCFVLCASAVTLAFASAAAAGCSSSSNGASTDDGGTIDAGSSDSSTSDSGADGATCGKLPPTGPTQIVQPSTTADQETGDEPKIVLDKKGRPVVGYMDHVPGSHRTLNIVTWDDCAGAWRAPVKVDDSLDENTGKAARVVGMAVDASDGRIAFAYQKIVHLVTPPRVNDTVAAYLAISSDDGLTFTTAKVSHHDCETMDIEGDLNDVAVPNVALANGKTYVTYTQDNHACGAVNDCGNAVVLQSGTGTTLTETLMPDSSDSRFGGRFIGRGFPLGIAVDSAGKVGIVAHREPPTAYDTVEGFWREGDADMQIITRSDTHQNDDGAGSLVFDGVKPRVISRLQQGQIGSATDYDLTFSSSDGAGDAGTGWTTIALPRPEAIQNTENITFGGGKVVVFAGGPHVFTSTDLATFTVDDLGLAQTSDGVYGTLDSSGKKWAVVEGVTPAASSLGGVVFYREP